MEQIRLKWLEDKARHSSTAWLPVAAGDPVLPNSLVKSTSEERGGALLT